MPSLRALLLNATLYLSMIVVMVLALPSLLLPRAVLRSIVRLWGRYFLLLCRVVGGLKVEVRGREKIPPGPLLVASKHQSIWETFAFLALFDDCCFILKRELTWIPLFGWLAVKARMVSVDRRGGARVLSQLNERARSEIRRGKGRQIIFFPEGTRRPPGAPPQYKQGISHLYGKLGVPCLPVALNAGLFWPRRSLAIEPGTILVEILDPLPPGLPRDEFHRRMQDDIETASDRLLAEGLASLADRAPVLPARATDERR